MKFPEEYRRPHPLGYPHQVGDPFGWFEIPMKIKIPLKFPHPSMPKAMKVETVIFAVMADNQTDWGHVSVSMRDRCPTWEEMCFIKDLFWDEHETVVQFHPPKSDYVNVAKYCLHLWHYNKSEMPRPPKIYV